ncbi:MAG: NAD(P)/FAD-dependent oxidoreductase [Dehalococcoidia bacterium]
MSVLEDVVVVGGGPAGYTAAFYLARADLAPLVVEGVSWGGLLQETTTVENFPGFPAGVLGPALMADLREQAGRFGARFLTEDATAIALGSHQHQVTVGAHAVDTRALVLTMGARHRRLGVPGELELGGRGVSYCATCDAPLYRGRDTVVVGGGDSAMEEALFLARFAETVTIVHRRAEFRASPVLVGRVRETGSIRLLTDHAVTAFLPGDGGDLERLRVVDTRSGALSTLDAHGAFVAVGHEPQSVLVQDQLPTDAGGYVEVLGRSTRTAVPGVFAAGDLVDAVYRQAVTAAGSGCQAALDAQAYLSDVSDAHRSAVI